MHLLVTFMFAGTIEDMVKPRPVLWNFRKLYWGWFSYKKRGKVYSTDMVDVLILLLVNPF